MTTFPLKDLCGEFCTERGNPGLAKLRDALAAAIEREETVSVDRSGVKMMTTSFIDELIPALALRYGKDRVLQCVTFSPPLEPLYLQQIDRGIRLRSG